MKKLRNLLLDKFNHSSFKTPPRNILFIYGEERDLVARNEFINKIKEKFPTAHIDSCNVSKKRKSDKQYDLVIPVTPYDMQGTIRRELEKFVFRMRTSYLVIYEDTYGYVRLANKLNLLCRLYLGNIFIVMYILLGFIFIVVPAYILYFVCYLLGYLGKKIGLRGVS